VSGLSVQPSQRVLLFTVRQSKSPSIHPKAVKLADRARVVLRPAQKRHEHHRGPYPFVRCGSEYRVQGVKVRESGVGLSGFRVQELGLRIEGFQGAGFRVQASGFRVQGSGVRVQNFQGSFMVQGTGCMTCCSGLRVHGSGCRAQGVGLRGWFWGSGCGCGV